MSSVVRSILITLSLMLAASAAALGQATVEGFWEGKIMTPGPGLEINVDLAFDEGGDLTGDISIPIQSIADMALTDLASEGFSVLFKIPGIPGDPAFDGTLSDDGSSIEGTFSQGGASFPFELIRGDDPLVQAERALDGFPEVIEQALADFNAPGLGLAVVAGGEVVFARGFGHRDREQDLPMTADSLFAIGSTTKAMTATLLGMFVDEGRLAWDEPLIDYLPEFRLEDRSVTARITPRDLVTHRSGMPRHDLLWYNNNEGTRAEMIARFPHLELTQDLRAKFQYNNLMFMTAGHLAGRLGGGTWEEVLRDRLFEPLGMSRSNFRVADSQADPDHALPYRENDDQEIELIPFRPIDLIGPAGSVNSSVNEMSRWILMNLRGGKVGERQLVKPSTLADIHSPHMPMGSTADRPEISQPVYGMGWVIDTYRGHRRVSHGGGIDGFITQVQLFPDDGLGLVAFTNIGSGLPTLIARHAADRLLELEPIDWLAEALEERKAGLEAAKEAEEKKEATRIADTAPSRPLAAYAGEYEEPGYGTLGISAAGESLTLSFNGIEAPLDHWHYDVWNGAENEDDQTFEDTKFLFRGDVNGNIASVEATLDLVADPIVFRKRPDPQLSDPEHLAMFTGSYALATGTQIEIDLSGGELLLSVPGQPTYTLEPDLSGRFVLKEARIISVGFETGADGRATKAVLYQPNGVFEASRVE
jgi:CubicO group peptidase (beta-lactamase class C family)